MLLVLMGIVVLGLTLRIYELGEKSLWLDEFKSINHAQGIDGIASIFSRSDNRATGNAHPPLYFALLSSWLFFGGGEFSLRLLSVLFAVIVIPLTYLMGRCFFSEKASLLGSFFVALSPLLLIYDREVRMYPLFVLLSTASILLFVRALRENNNRYWAGYTICTILNTYTHYHAFLVIASMWVFFLLSWRTYKALGKKFLISQAAVALAFSLWVPLFLAHVDTFVVHKGAPIFPSFLGFWIKPVYLLFSFSLGQTVLPWNFWVVVPGVVVFGVLWVVSFYSMRASRETGVFFLAFFFLPIVLGLVAPFMMPRYFLFLYPLFAMIIGQGIAILSTARIQLVAFLVVTILSGISVRNYYLGSEFHILAHVDPWREVGRFIAERVPEGDAVVYTGRGDVLRYYSGRDIKPSDEAIRELTQLENEGRKRIWIVVASPSRLEEGEEALKWLNERYQVRLEKRFGHDPHFSEKAKFFKKTFLEHRVRVYFFEREARTIS